MSKDSKRMNGKTRPAMSKKITLQIDVEDFEFAKRLAENGGYFGPEDCLNGVLNTAIMEWRDHTADLSREGAEQKRLHAIIDRQLVKIEVLKELFYEALEAKAHQDLEYRAEITGEPIVSPRSENSDDLDDEIPF